MNPFEFVLGLVLILTIGRIIRHRMGDRSAFDQNHKRHSLIDTPQENAETDRLRDEVKQLKERIHVLERIAVDKEDTLSRQIDKLRDR